jgi:hypothetical protein
MAKIVNADEFEKDLAAGCLPQYIWYTANLINDGHNATDNVVRNNPDES